MCSLPPTGPPVVRVSQLPLVISHSLTARLLIHNSSYSHATLVTHNTYHSTTPITPSLISRRSLMVIHLLVHCIRLLVHSSVSSVVFVWLFAWLGCFGILFFPSPCCVYRFSLSLYRCRGFSRFPLSPFCVSIGSELLSCISRDATVALSSDTSQSRVFSFVFHPFLPLILIVVVHFFSCAVPPLSPHDPTQHLALS